MFSTALTRGGGFSPGDLPSECYVRTAVPVSRTVRHWKGPWNRMESVMGNYYLLQLGWQLAAGFGDSFLGVGGVPEVT